MTHLSFLLKLRHGTELIFFRHRRVDPVQLPEIDALHAQALQASFETFPQAFRSCVLFPFSRTGAIEAALRRDHQVFGIRMQCLGDELFADIRAIRLGSVDEGGSQLHRASQHSQRLRSISRCSPHARAGDPHRTEPETMDRQISTQKKRAAVGR